MRKFLAAAAIFVIIITLPACSSNKQKEYEQLKADIVGMWCDINGPEYFENEGNPYYKLYEFTSNGGIIYHTPMAAGSFYTEDTYELRDNFLTVGQGGMCRVSVENDILTMTYNDGESKYRRMSIEEVSNFGAYYIDNDNYQKQLDYLGLLYGTDAEGHQFDENGNIRETEKNETSAETQASEQSAKTE